MVIIVVNRVSDTFFLLGVFLKKLIEPMIIKLAINANQTPRASLSIIGIKNNKNEKKGVILFLTFFSVIN
uniref:hypothetical protein n=1 Tax=Vibrio lentus TaxID=136468 RepID=UPI001E34A7D0